MRLPLDSGQVTGNNRYDAIIFNNPHAGSGSQTAQLVSQFKRSAFSVLAPGGEIHINVTKQLLINHKEIFPRLGLPDNKPSTLDNLPRFGDTRYYAPYIPQYTSGGAMRFYGEDPTRVRFLKNFVFR